MLEAFGENADHVAFLVDGYVGGPAAVTTCRRRFPDTFLHYHRAGHGAVTSPQSKRGYTAFVLAKMARLQGASGIHTGTMGFGKMEGDPSDRAIAYMIERDAADGPFYHQEWLGIMATSAMISGGMNALRLPGFFDNLGHANVVQTSGGGRSATSTGRSPAAAVAAPVRGRLDGRRGPARIREGAPRAGARLRVVPRRRRRPVPGLASGPGRRLTVESKEAEQHVRQAPRDRRHRLERRRHDHGQDDRSSTSSTARTSAPPSSRATASTSTIVRR